MSNRKAIVTLAVGDKYLDLWRRTCESNWREYAEKHGFDIVCIDKPLDDSERAKGRFLSWQKCLILGQDFAKRYERILWIDSDILINAGAAPDPTESVPVERVGVVEILKEPTAEWYNEAYRRLREYWGPAFIHYETPEEYYTRYGLERGFQYYAQNGVMVLSPRHHRELLEKVYYEHENKGGQYHHEMRPFSYELLAAGLEHWIEWRYNVQLLDYIIMHYPFLLNEPPRRGWIEKVKAKTGMLSGYMLEDIRRACVTAAFLDSYFLHFVGPSRDYMESVDVKAKSWRDCVLPSR